MYGDTDSLFQRTLYLKHNNHVFYLYVSFVLSKEPQTCALVWFTPKIDPETRIHVQVAPRKHLQGDGKCSKGRQSIKAVSLNKFSLWETDFLFLPQNSWSWCRSHLRVIPGVGGGWGSWAIYIPNLISHLWGPLEILCRLPRVLWKPEKTFQQSNAGVSWWEWTGMHWSDKSKGI